MRYEILNSHSFHYKGYDVTISRVESFKGTLRVTIHLGMKQIDSFYWGKLFLGIFKISLPWQSAKEEAIRKIDNL